MGMEASNRLRLMLLVLIHCKVVGNFKPLSLWQCIAPCVQSKQSWNYAQVTVFVLFVLRFFYFKQRGYVSTELCASTCGYKFFFAKIAEARLRAKQHHLPYVITQYCLPLLQG